jgi:hypothetical protein
MGLLLLTIPLVLLVGGLVSWGCSRRRRYLPPLVKDSRGAINAEDVHLDLQYGKVELKFFFRYANAHDVEVDGRYDIRTPPLLNIWTHYWINPGCRAESSLMFSLEFDWKTGSLILVKLQPGFDWQVFLDELAKLERAALGDVRYGKRREKRIA